MNDVIVLTASRFSESRRGERESKYPAQNKSYHSLGSSTELWSSVGLRRLGFLPELHFDGTRRFFFLSCSLRPIEVCMLYVPFLLPLVEFS